MLMQRQCQDTVFDEQLQIFSKNQLTGTKHLTCQHEQVVCYLGVLTHHD